MRSTTDGPAVVRRVRRAVGRRAARAGISAGASARSRRRSVLGELNGRSCPLDGEQRAAPPAAARKPGGGARQDHGSVDPPVAVAAVVRRPRGGYAPSDCPRPRSASDRSAPRSGLAGVRREMTKLRSPGSLRGRSASGRPARPRSRPGRPARRRRSPRAPTCRAGPRSRRGVTANPCANTTSGYGARPRVG